MDEKKKRGNITLYRGYQFKSERERQAAKEHIEREGDRDATRHRYSENRLPKIDHHDLTPKEVCGLAMEEKLRDGKISRDDRLNGESATFVTGDIHYANRYTVCQTGDFPLLAQLNVDPDRLVLDPVDFLYSLGYRNSHLRGQQWVEFCEKYKKHLTGAYGAKIMKYLKEIDRHYEKEAFDIHYVIDYMTLDTSLIRGHLKSSTLIRGKGSTVFKNSFQLIGGAKPEEFTQLRETWELPERTFKQELVLYEM